MISVDAAAHMGGTDSVPQDPTTSKGSERSRFVLSIAALSESGSDIAAHLPNPTSPIEITGK